MSAFEIINLNVLQSDINQPACSLSSCSLLIYVNVSKIIIILWSLFLFTWYFLYMWYKKWTYTVSSLAALFEYFNKLFFLGGGSLIIIVLSSGHLYISALNLLSVSGCFRRFFPEGNLWVRGERPANMFSTKRSEWHSGLLLIFVIFYEKWQWLGGLDFIYIIFLSL